MMNLDNFNVHLPNSRREPKRNHKNIDSTGAKRTLAFINADSHRVGIISKYNDDGSFNAVITKHRKRETINIPKEVLNLNGTMLYALPDNDKVDTWERRKIVDGYVFHKPEIVKMYWSNLVPKLKIILYFDINSKVIGYEQHIIGI